ncbi:hypothetical protein, partial [Sphingomonas parapaucimobilis]|uniref:hypothetical protein n=1 Tax=Sphingomonas parapaucimobilis TaxID=28213 RepID=UPI00391D8678
FRPNHLDNSRRHDAAPVSATVPHLWLAHHLVGKAEKTGRLQNISASLTMKRVGKLSGLRSAASPRYARKSAAPVS